MFNFGARLNICSHSYHEAIMKKNPHMVAGIHHFEDLNTPPIVRGGIYVDGITPHVTSVISYKMHYLSNDSSCLLNIALAEVFPVRTILALVSRERQS
jgi:hypothetical protein